MLKDSNSKSHGVMLKSSSKFLISFFLIMLNLTFCTNTLAYHIFVHVREISDASRSIVLEHRKGHKVLNDHIYGQILWNATDEQKEFCKKVHKKVIKDSEDLYFEVLDLSKQLEDAETKKDRIIYNHVPYSKKNWEKLFEKIDKCNNRINEILHSLVE